MANAAAAWSLGNDGSGEAADRRCVSPGCATYGRGRSQTCEITWFTIIATAAEERADAHASFHFASPYGRARSQSAIVAAA